VVYRSCVYLVVLYLVYGFKGVRQCVHGTIVGARKSARCLAKESAGEV